MGGVEGEDLVEAVDVEHCREKSGRVVRLASGEASCGCVDGSRALLGRGGGMISSAGYG